MEIEVSEKVIDKVAMGSRLDEMRKNERANCNWMEINKNEATHLRKGIVGDWRNYFTEEQNKRFDRLYCQKMSESSFKNNWDESILGITPPTRPIKFDIGGDREDYSSCSTSDGKTISS